MERRKKARQMWLALMAAVVALAVGAELAQAQLPNLAVTSVNGPDTGTISLRPSIEVLVTVQNKGASNAGAFRLGFYYSTDSTITTGDVYSGYLCPFDSGIKAGESASCSGKISAPRSLAAGTYYLGACADDGNEVTESNETDNCTADTAPIVLTKNSRR